MASNEKRAAPRVECEVPLRILRPWGFRGVRMLDASGTGVRLRVGLDGLGLEPSADVETVATAVEEAFGDDFLVEFNPSRLGRLIVRHLRVVRIGRCRTGDDHLELGCLLKRPFSREETAAIGLSLDIPDEFSQDAAGDAEAEAIDASERTVTFEALGAIVIPVRTEQPRPLFAGVVRLTPEDATLRIRDLQLSEAADTTVPVAAALAAIRGTLRDQATVQISRDEVLVWSGPVRIEALEVVEAASELLLSVSFFRLLGANTCERLGIVAA